MRSQILITCFILLIFGTFSGCGHAPQISVSNRKILEALQTAVSSKDSQWLSKVVKHVSEKRTRNEMSDAEFSAIDAIVKTAKNGDWKLAQKQSFSLSEAQRPLPDDLAMLKNHNGTQIVSQN
jgi:hypothetical protein